MTGEVVVGEFIKINRGVERIGIMTVPERVVQSGRIGWKSERCGSEAEGSR
jgi:hypothetical protein